MVRTKRWRIFSEETLFVSSAHASVHRGWFFPSVVFACQLEAIAQTEIQTTLDNCCCTSFLNAFVFRYRINLSEDQTIDIAMIEQLREAVDLLQDPNRYAYNS